MPLSLHSAMCNVGTETRSMPTNLAIDDHLLAEAVRRGRHKSKKDAANAALAEYIKLLQRRDAIRLMGTIDFVDDVDTKHSRRRRGA